MLPAQPHAWSMTWVWLHPFERRRGHLSKVWPFMTARYGSFAVDRPSPAMRAFLTRHQTR